MVHIPHEVPKLPEPRAILRDAHGAPSHAVFHFHDFVRLIAFAVPWRADSIVSDRRVNGLDTPGWLRPEDVVLIADVRKQKGWTQVRLGAKLGVPNSRISRMERHPETLTYRTLKRTAQVLGVSVGDLLEH